MDYRVLKDNELFLLTDKSGDIPLEHPYGLGLYKRDTRFLSEMSLTINGEPLILLKSEAGGTYESSMLLTNPHMEKDDEVELWRESIEIERFRYISDDVLYETIRAKSYYPKPVRFSLELSFEADFADMFIVRGFQHGEIGTKQETKVEEDRLIFNYDGADQINRSTQVIWEQTSGAKAEGSTITFPFALAHEEVKEIMVRVVPLVGEEKKEARKAPKAYQNLKETYEDWNANVTKVVTDHTSLNRLIERGIQDLRALSTDVGFGPFFVAGLPWFGVPFGRDSLIAALQTLPFQPEIAKGTLHTLAHYQGTKKDEWRDEEPGKIMHEIRYGELANTNQVPFTPYYGTIDATPLFLILLTEYVRWSKDLEFFKELLPNVESAIEWIDQYGDRDGDGFIEYHQESSKGIANQGWKDSADSVVHRNGEYAKSPIALAEVQGYVYQARLGIAELYESTGSSTKAEKLKSQAADLKEKFNEAFWMEDVGYYAIALDEHKNQVGTITSNPGHVLYSGLIDEDKQDQVLDSLVSSKVFSGYGIRTMAEGEAGYNPMSYHDGSVWPHDNSMILLGMGYVQGHEQANVVIEGLIDASRSFEYERLPELFCGYGREEGKPVPYPVACSPQAWAAGTPLTFVRTMLGLYPTYDSKELKLSPSFINGLNEMAVEDLPFAGGRVSFTIKRKEDQYDLDVAENTTGLHVSLHSDSNIHV
ncbi:amylo-alpha-1,6-glucosidase [Halobacillus sp. BBL2006]|uniref:amylo-alpha-1,6-glucosidase n=1 Tax=Halobacillus sp. BBL2006 TaxID=1543706 RepID=UPI000543AF76|nr:amylo-alpha-1,6-glucosidase [Halobacillus sp. BBL2006]KHE70095.1 amylo-alpha-1,6-glucosidase [Halobacillus sp. BBL2006]